MKHCFGTMDCLNISTIDNCDKCNDYLKCYEKSFQQPHKIEEIEG